MIPLPASQGVGPEGADRYLNIKRMGHTHEKKKKKKKKRRLDLFRTKFFPAGAVWSVGGND